MTTGDTGAHIVAKANAKEQERIKAFAALAKAKEIQAKRKGHWDYDPKMKIRKFIIDKN